jgi:lipoyl(octanoyl) transferase
MKTVWLGRCDLAPTAEAMKAFTEARGEGSVDELWLCEHERVYTQGIAGRAEHLLNPSGIPIVATNRGGQVTYHGPGQVTAYPLVDLRRLQLHVKTYVHRLENALLKTLESYGVTGHRVVGAPGVYVRLDDPFGHAALPRSEAPLAERLVGLGKIAALGVKVTRHCAYHGVALNVAMDLSPFAGINPCGYAGLATVDLATLGVNTTWHEAASRLADSLTRQLAPPTPADVASTITSAAGSPTTP